MTVPLEAALPKNLGPDFTPMLERRRCDYRAALPIERHRRTFVTHSGIAIKRLRLVRETGYGGELPPGVNRHFHRYGVYKFLTEKRIRADDQELLLVHNHWGSGYYHWLTECLLKALLVDPAEYTVIVPEDLPPFAAESLALFPFADRLSVPPGHGVRARSLTIVGNPHPGRPDPAHLTLLRQTLQERCGDGPTGGERLYITRRDAAMRKVENEADVERVLGRYGFETVDPANHGFCDQVRLFSRCRALVSIHGAGLANLMFMPQGARVLELLRGLEPEPAIQVTYWHLCTACGADYYYQFCRHGQNSGAVVNDTNVIVDLDELERNLELMLD